jgi:hypothetical protein
MITIRTSKITSYRKNDLSESMRVTAYNGLVDAYAKELSKELTSKKCEVHPTRTSVLVLKADLREIIKVDKAGFCCKDFSNSINIQVKK